MSETVYGTTKQIRVIPMVCGRCGWAWDYSGCNRYYATCPHCRIHLRIEKHAAIKERKIPTTTGVASPKTNQPAVGLIVPKNCAGVSHCAGDFHET
jgi:hypothetical protein